MRDLGTVSLVPEKHGADYLMFSKEFKLVGVQRKELGDFVGSVYDGRLGKEVQQMKTLGLAMLLLEGRPSWTGDSLLMQSSSTWTMSQHLGTIWSLQSRGIWIASAEGLGESTELLLRFEKWVGRENHGGSLDRRPKVKGEWGKATSKEWMSHLLQGFEGVGSATAEAILEHFGRMPLGWLVDAESLSHVPGIGKKTAERLVSSLNGWNG